jgi:dienelactone hydrolase
VRGIDLLETLPEVNAKRIGVMGHGLGGQSAVLTAAFDSRIAAVVSSCGFTTFARYKGGNLADWADPRMLPRIRGVYGNDPARIPFDFAEVIASLAPRPVFVIAPLHDKVMEVAGVKSAVKSASAVYDLRRAGSALRVAHPESGREFAESVRDEAFAWLDKRLK